MIVLTILFGAIVGFSLGLTGGGGSLFAIPLLVYGLSLDIDEAIGVSLASVGITALIGALDRLWKKQVEFVPAVIFGAAGMVGIPVGSWLIGFFTPDILLSLFAVLMVLIASRMWLRGRPKPEPQVDQATEKPKPHKPDEGGKVLLTRSAILILVLSGFVTGVFSRLFGVGGGFVIVPALIVFSGMDIHRAVATSLLVIVIITSSGVAMYLIEGRPLSLSTTALFATGGVVGMAAGSWIGQKLPNQLLQRVFAVVIVLVAILVLAKTWAS